MKAQPSEIETNFKREFQIWQEGVTYRLITILSKNGEPFDRDAKISLYKWMGYTVYDLNGNLI